MSKEMKDFLSQFMNQPVPTVPQAVEPVVEKTEKIEKEIPAKSFKIIKEKTEAIKPTAPKKVAKSVVTDRVGEDLSLEGFMSVINDKKFNFDKKKNLQIDDQLFTVLNLLKQHKDIKSIATLLNAIVEKFVQDNKDDLKKIFSKNPLG